MYEEDGGMFRIIYFVPYCGHHKAISISSRRDFMKRLILALETWAVGKSCVDSSTRIRGKGDNSLI